MARRAVGNQACRIYHFTLLELIVCLTLLAAIGSITLFKGLGFLTHHKAKRAAEKLYQDLLLSQSIANCYEIDIENHLTLSPEGLTFQRTTAEPMQRFAHLFRLSAPIREIQNMKIQGQDRYSMQLMTLHNHLLFPAGSIVFTGKDGFAFEIKIDEGRIQLKFL